MFLMVKGDTPGSLLGIEMPRRGFQRFISVCFEKSSGLPKVPLIGYCIGSFQKGPIFKRNTTHCSLFIFVVCTDYINSAPICSRIQYYSQEKMLQMFPINANDIVLLTIKIDACNSKKQLPS